MATDALALLPACTYPPLVDLLADRDEENPYNLLLTVTAIAMKIPKELMAQPRQTVFQLLFDILGFPDETCVAWTTDQHTTAQNKTIRTLYQRFVFQGCVTLLKQNTLWEKHLHDVSLAADVSKMRNPPAKHDIHLASMPMGDDIHPPRYQTLRREIIRNSVAYDMSSVAMMFYRYHLLYPLHLMRPAFGHRNIAPFNSIYCYTLFQEGTFVAKLKGECGQAENSWDSYISLEEGAYKWRMRITLTHYMPATCTVGEWLPPPEKTVQRKEFEGRVLQMMAHAARDLRVSPSTIDLDPRLQDVAFPFDLLLLGLKAFLALPLSYNLRFFRLLQAPLTSENLDVVLDRMDRLV